MPAGVFSDSLKIISNSPSSAYHVLDVVKVNIDILCLCSNLLIFCFKNNFQFYLHVEPKDFLLLCNCI